MDSYVPLARASSGGGQRLGVPGDEHRRILALAERAPDPGAAKKAVCGRHQGREDLEGDEVSRLISARQTCPPVVVLVT